MPILARPPRMQHISAGVEVVVVAPTTSFSTGGRRAARTKLFAHGGATDVILEKASALCQRAAALERLLDAQMRLHSDASVRKNGRGTFVVFNGDADCSHFAKLGQDVPRGAAVSDLAPETGATTSRGAWLAHAFVRHGGSALAAHPRRVQRGRLDAAQERAHRHVLYKCAAAYQQAPSRGERSEGGADKSREAVHAL